MELTFLEAAGNVRLSKTYIADKQGNITKVPYPHSAKFKTHKVECKTLKRMYSAFREQASKGHCFIKGRLNRDLQFESRKGTHSPQEPTQLLVLDWDGIQGKDIDQALELLGLSGVSRIVQYSASMGLEPEKGLSAHVFILLDKPYTPAELKAWLTWKNLTIPDLRSQISLTASARALWWPLDVTVCQNDKLIFIADPVCKGVTDEMAGKRWSIKETKLKAATLELPNIRELDKLKQETLNELRTAAGLDTRKSTFNDKGILSNPESAVVSEERIDGEFVRINLLGEHASFGHWYPIENPEILYSFKDEEPTLLRKLDPDYYRRAKQRADERRIQSEDKLAGRMGQDPDESTGLHYLAFIDDKTDQYFIGTVDPKRDLIDIRQTRSKDKVDFYLMEHGQDVPEWYPRWKYEMDLRSDVVFNPDAKFINRYEPSNFIKNHTKGVRNPPSVTANVIKHICNYDEEVYERFLNWLACKLQFKERIGTAWLFHGTMGTGKGTLFNSVIRPIFGIRHTNACKLVDFESDHNQFIPEVLVRLVDEANAEAVKNLDKVRSVLWTAITEPFMTVNQKFVQQYEAENFTDYLIFSNATIPIDIEDGDRRFNIAPRQESPYPGNDRTGLERAVSSEVQEFCNYLFTREADIKLAREPLNNEAKITLADQHTTSTKDICSKIRKGNIGFFLDFLPVNPLSMADDSLPFYEEVIQLVMDQQDEGKLFVQGEITSLFLYLTDQMPSKAKFASLLKKNGLIPKRMRRGGNPSQAVEITWTITKADREQWQSYQTKKQPKMRVAK